MLLLNLLSQVVHHILRLYLVFKVCINIVEKNTDYHRYMDDLALRLLLMEMVHHLLNDYAAYLGIRHLTPVEFCYTLLNRCITFMKYVERQFQEDADIEESDDEYPNLDSWSNEE